jgi:hypothetical protein
MMLMQVLLALKFCKEIIVTALKVAAQALH